MLKTNLIFLWLVLFVMNVAAQEGTYYFTADFKPVPDSSRAKIIKNITRKTSGTFIVKSCTREEDNSWKALPKRKIIDKGEGIQLIKISDKLLTPKKIYRYYNSNPGKSYDFKEYIKGQLYRSGTATNLVPLMLQDTVTEYFPSGLTKSVSIYNNNQLISNQNWLRDGSPYISDIYNMADTPPVYVRGFAFFSSFIRGRLSETEIDLKQIDDQVVLGWVINEEGEMEGVHVVSGKFRDLNQIMANLVSQLPGKWKPATINGKKVRYYMTVPFNFGQRSTRFDYLQLNNAGQLDWD